MQGLLIFLLIGWFVVRALNGKNAGAKKTARRDPRQMRDVSALTGRPGAAAGEARDPAAVSQARPARPKAAEPCRECETDFGYRPAAPNRISDPRPAVEAAPADAPCDACETNFGYRAEPSAPLSREDGAPVASAPGLSLAFDRNAIVQGVVYSEILGNRPRARSNKWNPYAR